MRPYSLLWLALAIGGCGGRESSSSGAPLADSTIDGALDAVADVTSETRFDVADTASEGAIDATPDHGDAACDDGSPGCCNGVQCIGDCLADPDGGAHCDCFGVAGGCPDEPGMVCCERTKTCMNGLPCSGD